MSIKVFGASLAASPATITALAESTGESATKFATPGKPITEWVKLIPSAHLGASDTVVAIETGGNGVATTEQIRAADQQLRAAGAKRVAWVVFADWPETSRVAANRRATRDRIRATVRDVLTLPKPAVEALVSDQVHFTTAGYRQMGQLIAQRLRATGSSQGFNPGWLVFGGVLAVTSWIFWKTAR